MISMGRRDVDGRYSAEWDVYVHWGLSREGAIWNVIVYRATRSRMMSWLYDLLHAHGLIRY